MKKTYKSNFVFTWLDNTIAIIPRISPIQQGEHGPKTVAMIAKVILLFGRGFSEKEAVSIEEDFYKFSFKYTANF